MNGPLALVAAIWTTMISRKDFQQQPQCWPQNLWLQPRRSLKTASKLQRLLQFIPRDLRLECMVLGTIHILRKHVLGPFCPPPPHTHTHSASKWWLTRRFSKIGIKKSDFFEVKLVPYASLCPGKYLDQFFMKFWVDWWPFYLTELDELSSTKV